MPISTAKFIRRHVLHGELTAQNGDVIASPRGALSELASGLGIGRSSRKQA